MPAAIAFVVVTLIHLGAQATAPGGVLADLTQVLLVPVLAWFLLATTPAPPSRPVRLALLALGLSWLGDTLPRFADEGSTTGLALMLGCYLLAQVVYAVVLRGTGLDRVARSGVVALVVFDVLIALRALADVELPLHAVWVMLTYVLGQALLVAAIAHQDRARPEAA